MPTPGYRAVSINVHNVLHVELSLSATDPAPHQNTTNTQPDTFHHAVISITFTAILKNTLTPNEW